MRPKMKRIHTIEGDNEHRLLLLGESVKELQSLPEALLQFNDLHHGEPQPFEINITYDQLGVDEVLKKLLPDTIAEIPTAYEQAGHLAHVNLREESLPYKHLIGQVLLDKNPSLKTVVNKVGQIETEFRTFPMEVQYYYTKCWLYSVVQCCAVVYCIPTVLSLSAAYAYAWYNPLSLLILHLW